LITQITIEKRVYSLPPCLLRDLTVVVEFIITNDHCKTREEWSFDGQYKQARLQNKLNTFNTPSFRENTYSAWVPDFWHLPEFLL
jgi:hypothetical protein